MDRATEKRRKKIMKGVPPFGQKILAASHVDVHSVQTGDKRGTVWAILTDQQFIFSEDSRKLWITATTPMKDIVKIIRNSSMVGVSHELTSDTLSVTAMNFESIEEARDWVNTLLNVYNAVMKQPFPPENLEIQ